MTYLNITTTQNKKHVLIFDNEEQAKRFLFDNGFSHCISYHADGEDYEEPNKFSKYIQKEFNIHRAEMFTPFNDNKPTAISQIVKEVCPEF